MYVGTLSEQVSSRRTWRLGGGFIKYQSTSTLQYDGDTRVRRVSAGVFFLDFLLFFCVLLLAFFLCFTNTHTHTHTASTEKGATDSSLTTSMWGETQSYSKVMV